MTSNHKNILNFLDKDYTDSITWNDVMSAYMKIYKLDLGKVKSIDELSVFHSQLTVKDLNGTHEFKIWVEAIDKFCENWLKLSVVQ